MIAPQCIYRILELHFILFSTDLHFLTTFCLRSFLEALVKSSQIQLFGRPLEHSASPRSTKAMSRPLSAVATSVLHLHRLTELVLVCSRCSHSLLNMMQVRFSVNFIKISYKLCVV